jgi:hypothetical protein
MRCNRASGRAGLLVLLSTLLFADKSSAQALIVGAYAPAPVKVNIATFVYSFNKGDLTFDPALPVEDGKATINASALGYSRSLNLAGRFSTLGVLVPIFNGKVEGLLAGKFESRTRHGLGDLVTRFAVNLVGAPAMTPKQFAGYRQTTIVGFSLVVVAPTGQYDPSRIINLGTNRWAFSPEVGFSRRRGHWTVEADAGGAFFTDNSNFNNGATREQAPIAAVQGHVTFTVRKGFWVAADANFWRGGRTTVNGVESTVEQKNSRVGFTLALPIKTRQIRIACAFGAYTRIGGDFATIGVSYSHAWMRHP